MNGIGPFLSQDWGSGVLPDVVKVAGSRHNTVLSWAYGPTNGSNHISEYKVHMGSRLRIVPAQDHGAALNSAIKALTQC